MDLLTSEDFGTPAISPVKPVAGWKQVAVKDNGEPLVALGLDSDYPTLHTDGIYFGQHHCTSSPYRNWQIPGYEPDIDLSGALITAFARQTVAAKLLDAQNRLPRGMRLIVCDAYRPLEVQEALYQFYYQQLQQVYPDWSPDQLSEYTQNYVSLPSTDPSRPSPHNTGGAVDIMIVRLPRSYWERIDQIDHKLLTVNKTDWEQHYFLQTYRAFLLNSVAEPLPLNTRFDHGGVAAGVEYFEQLAGQRQLTKKEHAALVSYRIVANAMLAAGFQAFAPEIWHWNFGNQMAAKAAGEPQAIYGAIELSPTNQAHEAMRRRHWHNAGLLASGYEWVPPAGLEHHYQVVKDLVRAFGNPHIAWSRQMAEKIAPTLAAA